MCRALSIRSDNATADRDGCLTSLLPAQVSVCLWVLSGFDRLCQGLTDFAQCLQVCIDSGFYWIFVLRNLHRLGKQQARLYKACAMHLATAYLVEQSAAGVSPDQWFSAFRAFLDASLLTIKTNMV